VYFEDDDPYRIMEVVGDSRIPIWKRRLTFFCQLLLLAFVYYTWEALVISLAICFPQNTMLALHLALTLSFIFALKVRENVPVLVGQRIYGHCQRQLESNKVVGAVAVVVVAFNIAFGIYTWGWSTLYLGSLVRAFLSFISFLWLPDRIIFVLINYCLISISFFLELWRNGSYFRAGKSTTGDGEDEAENDSENENKRGFDFNKFSEERRRRAATKAT